jgi:hypothetical protein
VTLNRLLSGSYGCINSPLNVTATSLFTGTWSSPNSSVTFLAFNSSSLTFVSNVTGDVVINWSGTNCSISSVVRIIASPVARIAPFQQQPCGGSVTVTALLVGDARTGTWSSAPLGSFQNPLSAGTVFNWTGGGSFTFSFLPDSVCSTPASLTVDLLESCPQVISKEATLGIAVGATIGALALAAVGVLVAIKAYQAQNRNLVKFRDNEVPLLNKEYYKF